MMMCEFYIWLLASFRILTFSQCVWSCEPGFYGTYCNLSCSVNCLDRMCAGIGECTEGCKSGFFGTKCANQCKKPEKTCTKCPEECKEGFCNLGSICISGCVNGYYGNNCTCDITKECHPACGENCLETTSFKAFPTTTSNCTSGQQCSSCEDSTDHCTTECFTGFYGPLCNISCSEGCKDNLCTTHEGGIEKCVAGCKAGLYGTRCNIPCSLNEECQKCPRECEDGFCQLESRCVSGCEDSYYGTNCTSCGPDCEVCDRRTGICQEERTSLDTVYYWVIVTFGTGVCVFVMISILVLASSRIIQLTRKREQPNRTVPVQVIRLDRTDDSGDTTASGNGRYIQAIHNHYDECNEECYA